VITEMCIDIQLHSLNAPFFFLCNKTSSFVAWLKDAFSKFVFLTTYQASSTLISVSKCLNTYVIRNFKCLILEITKYFDFFRDLRLRPQCNRDLRSSGMLCCVNR